MAREPIFLPRAWGFRGSVEAAAFLIDPVLIGEEAARARVLSLWSPGATLRRCGGRLLLHLPAPLRVRAEEAPGAPLVAHGDLLCGAPGLDAEARRRGASPGSVVLLSGGEFVLLSPSTGEREEPASWLDLSAFEVAEAEGHGAPVAQAPAGLPALRVDVREVLGGKIPPANPQAQKIAAELARLAQPAEEKAAPAASRSLSSPVARWLGGMFQFLSAVVTRLSLSSGSSPLGKAAARSAAGEAPPRPGLVIRPVEPAGPGFLERLSTRLNDWAARLLLASKMAPMVGRKQAEFLGNMMEMFQRGDLEEALRHAIPLGGDSSGGTSFTLGVPGPRDGLSLSVGASGGGTSVLPFAGLYDELRRLYRAAFERLDAQGRVEEAAFVLAELLRESEEAVAYLERHDRLLLAAELAEGRALAPGLVVRQWFLAGNRSRALLLARRHGAFADALVRLKEHPEEAKALAILWADQRASEGDYLGAELLLQDFPALASLRVVWLERAILLGGVVGLEARLRKLQMVPESFEDMAREVERLCRDPAPEAIHDRAALAMRMTDGPWENTSPLVALARPLLRAMLRDAGDQGEEPAVLAKLRGKLGDAMFRADWPVGGSSSGASGSLEVALPAAGMGALPVLDAVLLPGGKALVALGEAGALLLSREGKRLHHFEQPAEKIVLSTRGDRALVLAPRGRRWRVARLDTAGLRSRVWTEVELTAWAPEFDGASWLVGVEGGILCEVDALNPGWSAIWQLREPRRRVVACWFWAQAQAIVLAAVFEDATGAASLWQWDPSSRRLLRRDDLPEMEVPGPRCDAFAWVGGADVGAIRCENYGRIQALSGNQREFLCVAPGGYYTAAARGNLVGVASQDKVHLWRTRPGAGAQQKGSLTLEGAAQALVHPSPFGVAVADERGRLVCLVEDEAGRIRMLRTLRVQ
jgi:hypothetical protein